MYNVRTNSVNYYGRMMPQGICVERNNGAAIVQGCVGALSAVQASIYPRVGVKANMCGVIYLF